MRVRVRVEVDVGGGVGGERRTTVENEVMAQKEESSSHPSSNLAAKRWTWGPSTRLMSGWLPCRPGIRY